MSGNFDQDAFKKMLPAKFKGSVSKEVINDINGILADPGIREVFKENLVSHTSILQDGRYQMYEYVNAVKYVTYKLLGDSNVQAYAKTFPDRYKRFVAEELSDKRISSYVAAFNKTQLVNKITEQAMIPAYILNAPMFQRALNVQADLMVNSDSDKVRTDAANSILTHLKRPEALKVDHTVKYEEDSTIDDLRKTTQDLVNQQKKMIQEKVVSTQDIASSRIIPKGDIEDAQEL